MTVETHARHGDETGLACNGFGQFFTDPRGLASNEGKKMVPCPSGQAFEWRSSKRPIPAPGSEHVEKPEGLRKVEQAPGRSVSIRERRHIRQVESKEEITDRPVGPAVVIRENGLRAVDQPAREVDLTHEIQRKVQINDLRTQRNGFSCKSLGDKAYKHPEYSDKFFHTGNIIVGSGFHRGHFKKTEPRNATSVQLVTMERKGGPAKSFEEKQREKLVFEARMEVEELTVDWEKEVLKQTADAKYEYEDSDDEAVANPR